MAETKKPSKWETFVALAKNLFEESPENTAEEGTPAPAAASEALEDGSELFFEGELAEGTAVFTDAELTTPAADGDHKLASGKTITVTEGKVTAIVDGEVEPDALAAANARIAELESQLSAKNTVEAANSQAIKDLQAKVEQFGKTILKAQANVTAAPAPQVNPKTPVAATGSHPLDEAAKKINNRN